MWRARIQGAWLVPSLSYKKTLTGPRSTTKVRTRSETQVPRHERYVVGHSQIVSEVSLSARSVSLDIAPSRLHHHLWGLRCPCAPCRRLRSDYGPCIFCLFALQMPRILSDEALNRLTTQPCLFSNDRCSAPRCIHSHEN